MFAARQQNLTFLPYDLIHSNNCRVLMEGIFSWHYPAKYCLTLSLILYVNWGQAIAFCALMRSINLPARCKHSYSLVTTFSFSSYFSFSSSSSSSCCIKARLIRRKKQEEKTEIHLQASGKKSLRACVALMICCLVNPDPCV